MVNTLGFRQHVLRTSNDRLILCTHWTDNSWFNVIHRALSRFTSKLIELISIAYQHHFAFITPNFEIHHSFDLKGQISKIQSSTNVRTPNLLHWQAKFGQWIWLQLGNWMDNQKKLKKVLFFILCNKCTLFSIWFIDNSNKYPLTNSTTTKKNLKKMIMKKCPFKHKIESWRKYTNKDDGHITMLLDLNTINNPLLSILSINYLNVLLYFVNISPHSPPNPQNIVKFYGPNQYLIIDVAKLQFLFLLIVLHNNVNFKFKENQINQ